MNPLQAAPDSLVDNAATSEMLNYELSPRQLLKQLLQATAVSLVLACLLFILRGNFSINDTWLAAAYSVLLLGGYRLLHTGKINWLAHGYTAVFWLSLTTFMVVFGSSHIPSPGAYTIVILVSALLLRGRVAFVYTMFSLIAGLLLAVATQTERIPLYVYSHDHSTYIIDTVPQAFAIFSLLGISYHALRFTLQTLRFNEYDLIRIRQTLGQRTADLSATNNQLRQEIHERQQIEAELAQQRTFLRQIIDTIPNFISVKDKDGRFLIVNQALATAYQKKPANIEGRTSQELDTVNREIEKFEGGDQAVLSTQDEMFWPNLSYTDLQGTQRWYQMVKRPLFDPTTGSTHILSIANDITPIRATTEALREKEENFRTLVEASFEGIIICVDHIIQEANINFATMFGYAAVSEVLGKNASNFIASGNLQKLMARQPKVSVEAVGVRQDQSTFPLELVSHAINYQGQAAQITGYHDITTRKQAAEAEQHARKLESLGIMAGGLAHDFNNLLVAMMGQIAIAKAKIEPDHDCHSNLDKAIQATETAAMLTRQLLAYTGQGHFEVIPIHLNNLISQNLQLFQDALPPNITFQTNLHDPLPHIMADGVQVQQIIMNLLLNAAEALGTQPGTITITTAPYQLNRDQLSQWQTNNEDICPGHFVLLEMADSGRGMDKATINRIFDPFFSTKGTGRGLGLAAVLGIVRGHNGSVRARSQPGQGTTFQFLFPSEESAPVKEDTAVTATVTQQNTVLIIDDEEHVREAINDILHLGNIPVLSAANGQAGIDLFLAQQNKIGVILLDLSMPGMSGVEVFTALREIDPAAKIILSSGFTEAEILQKMAGIRPTDFLKKPYRLETVLNVVKKHLA